MEPDWEPARASPERSRVWREVMPGVAASLRDRSEEMSVAMLERVAAAMPELTADPDDAETNRASNEANLLLIADLIERGADPRGVELPAPTLAYAAVGAHQNIPLVGLIRAYRIGHAYGWEVLLGLLGERVSDPADFAVAVPLLSAWLHEYVDVASSLAEEAYARVRESWLRSTSAIRAETIAAVLEGGAPDPDAASQRLSYDLGGSHVALVAWAAGADQDADRLAAVEVALRAVASRLGSDRPLIHPTGIATAAAWVGSSEALGDDDLGVLGEELEAGQVRAAAGDPGQGLEGFRQSFREAMEARRVAILAADPEVSVTRYRDVALAAIATADPEQAERFVHRLLEPLVPAEGAFDRLVETLRAYLDEGASHSRAANRLGVHENTVRYRVRQAEDLFGGPIACSDLDLHVALAMREAGVGAQHD